MKEGYARISTGELAFVGKYTVEMRNHYMAYRVERYLIDHPEKTRKEAGRAARHSWRLKAAKSIGLKI